MLLIKKEVRMTRQGKILYDLFSFLHVFALLSLLQVADRAPTSSCVRLHPAAMQVERVTRTPIMFASLHCKAALKRLRCGK